LVSAAMISWIQNKFRAASERDEQQRVQMTGRFAVRIGRLGSGSGMGCSRGATEE
jgi:hypothetical protein